MTDVTSPEPYNFLEHLPEFITAIAAIIAIAASGYFQNKTLKENKKNNIEAQKLNKETVLSSIVSAHRQNWVNELREDISHYMTLVHEAIFLTRQT